MNQAATTLVETVSRRRTGEAGEVLRRLLLKGAVKLGSELDSGLAKTGRKGNAR